MTTETTNHPTHRVHAVTKRAGKNYWTEIGAIWPHRDGKGFNQKLYLVPLSQDVEIVIRAVDAGDGNGA